ncbi:hypothetical protein Q4Q39_01135 [Flavivirga amylovorans]|uniref:DUF5011 domain-containing protein n=1 Tax=Flavivirga amylovorans TaxID=870486 RepID=A0ABT8WWD3_9FLAO|nr:hypothetical protein [Flavivirga amylovorans]MDO5985994.1 hypothetical protein [Flavivirga amylovorans]
MKEIIKYIACITLLIFSSCETESTGNVNSITNLPLFEFEAIVVHPMGVPFSAAATAIEAGEELPVEFSSDIDVNVPGVYDVVYSAVNSDGFGINATQKVIVHDPNIIGTDVSGNIFDTTRNERTGIISLVEGTTSIFFVTDFAFGGTFPMWFQMDGDTISEIPQVYPFGATSVDLTYDPIERQFTTFVNPYGFGYTFKYQ